MPPTSLIFIQSRPYLTDDELIFFREFVGRNFEVQRSRSLSNTSRDIVVGTVAGTEPTTEVASLTNRYTTQMCADTCE